ncbi:MAG TPA: plastocyanin/azurin family copper-binding protein [Solirubrobacteraceae bacterium]|nr:plastocyanin/azurin family copper-binding protein [Solirubrobacteraceae bacterium]
MKRLLVAFLCALVAAIPAGVVATAAAAPASAHLLVYAQEWSLWPSRSSVPAGKVIVQLWNRGQDAHDLRIRKVGAHGHMTGPVIDGIKITLPGQVSQATWDLKAGRYELYCSMPGHLKMGMHARLTVTRT